MAATLPGAVAGVAALPCPCGRLAPAGKGKTGKPLAYGAFCQPWHLGQPTPTPEALMRSRYTAFVLGLPDYLLATWASNTRPPTLELEAGTHWLRLEMRAHRLVDDTHGVVEFVARSRVAGRSQRLHERSYFMKEDGRWAFVGGDMLG